MSYDTARTLLTTAFQAAWVGGGELFPVQVDNVKFDKPQTNWGRWSIQFGDSNQQALGSDYTRAQGILWLQVFIPTGGGTRPALQALDKLAAALNRFKGSSGTTHVQVQTWSVRPSGPSEGMQQQTCWAPFYADFNA